MTGIPGRPPFRAEHVGSLLRPPALLAARERHGRGEIGPAELRAVEDQAVRGAVALQEAAGLQGVTDGEFRRAYFHLDFLQRLAGVVVKSGTTAHFRGREGEIEFAVHRPEVVGRLRHVAPIQGADFDFLQSATGRTAKVTIPSPTMLHFRGGREGVSRSAYPEMEVFFAELAAAYRAEIADLAARGCTYLQLDDTNLAYLCDPAMRERARGMGEDPDQLPLLYARLINDAIAHRPPQMAVCVHLCRGNYRSHWAAEGGYEPVAEVLFNEMDVDGYLLEYDDRRSGDFLPLRFVPPGKKVVLGLVSSKVPELEPPDTLKRRIDEAARYVDPADLALSPQCGFSSTVEGNRITEADQQAKLRLCVEVAAEVWG